MTATNEKCFDLITDYWALSVLASRSKIARVGPICEGRSTENDDWVELHANESKELTMYSSMKPA